MNRYQHYYQNLEPIFKSRQTQAFLMITLSLFTIAFFGLFAIRPTLKTIASLQKQIADQSYVNKQLETKINSLIQAQNNYSQIEADLPLIYGLLPAKPEFPSLLRRLENVSGDSQTEISTLDFDKMTLYPLAKLDQNKTSTTQLSFTFGLGGNYKNLTDAIDRLTKLDRLVTINSAILAGGNENENQQQDTKINMTLETRSYYFPAYDKK